MPTVPAWIEDYATVVGPEPDDVIEEMDEYAVKKGFPTVGPAVGGWLEQLARMVGAESVFEFGSGYGYSAYWLARGLPATGEVVLTEIDKDELDLAREYLSRGDFETTIHYEHGDAIDIVGEYDGPFDVVLIDNEKTRYRDAFEAVREKVAPGGIVVADNAIAGGGIDADGVRELLTGEREAANETTEGIASFVRAIHGDPRFAGSLLPVGEGVVVATRVE
ncbi:Putative O-methyltransferase YrrM [Halorhabdus sp. SVX81]|uniref:O-methyltransferase n=1 Tax=Halorhabdus sp. SVX81 TaxID=2978283 RepID=UPI0023D9B173|nr:O-methyltransferase [Halorhabdus sp. SVX81]WEL17887.1 Putative O-methyltransferase YrrM [Halorhabdus sp. SVX81]